MPEDELHAARVVPLPSVNHMEDALALTMERFGPFRCPVCEEFRHTDDFGENLRETGRCDGCGAMNRQRQLTYVLASRLRRNLGSSSWDVATMLADSHLTVYTTEANGAVHARLSDVPGFFSSEYLGPERSPGEVVDGVRHEDLQDLSFADASIDVVLSADVLEHVPDPYRAHREVHRVLKPGGVHIFTVPFLQHQCCDEVYATMEGGEIRYHITPPIYHDDPVRPEGVLVYTLFGFEMLTKLERIGFRTTLYRLHEPRFGILGDNAIVFEAEKV